MYKPTILPLAKEDIREALPYDTINNKRAWGKDLRQKFSQKYIL